MQTPELILAIIQSISTVVLVIVTIQYVRITRQTMELQIVPRLSVRFYGDEATTTLELTNSSTLNLETGRVQISVGYANKDGSLCPWMKCVFVHEWEVLRPRVRLSLRPDVFLNPDWIDRMDKEAPAGTELCLNSLHLQYSFVRNADLKEFCFRQDVSFGRKHDGTLYFVGGLKPAEPVGSLEALVATKVKS